MSCDWNIWCLDCGEEHYFEDANHRVELMRLLIRHADRIADLDPLFRDQGAPSPSWDIQFQTMWGPIDTGYFVKHRGHRLVPRNEYGHVDDECGVDFKCSLCVHEHTLWCRRPVGHGGEHMPARDDGGK